MRDRHTVQIAKVIKENLDLAVNVEEEFFDSVMAEAEYFLDSLLRERPTKSLSE